MKYQNVTEKNAIYRGPKCNKIDIFYILSHILRLLPS